jgi:uncharacterized protein (DUF2236 family)
MAEGVSTARIARVWGAWPYLVPLTGRVLALQLMHPVVAAGIRDHSAVFEDPWGRLVRTYRHALQMAFGDAPRAARVIRELHRGIAGVGYDGRRYHAWSPAAWTWVHLTTFEAMLYALELLDGRVAPEEQEALYDEWRTIGLLYGVSDSDMPPDVAGLRAYVDRGMRELVVTPTAERVVHLAFDDLPAPRRVPRVAWPVLRPFACHAARVLLAGAFPPAIRAQLGVGWTRLDELQYRAAARVLRHLAHRLPDRLRLFPVAYRELSRPPRRPRAPRPARRSSRAPRRRRRCPQARRSAA